MRIGLVRLLILVLLSVVAAVAAHAQARVANFSTGRAGTANFEQFAFWVRDGRRAEIVYTRGAQRTESEATWIGTEVWRGSRAFRLKLADGREFYLVPAGRRLRVSGASGRYSRVFRWQYEGPVNGRGTFCEPCAQDEAEAAALVRNNFMR